MGTLSHQWLWVSLLKPISWHFLINCSFPLGGRKWDDGGRSCHGNFFLHLSAEPQHRISQGTMITDSLFGNAKKGEPGMAFAGAVDKIVGSLLPMDDPTKPVFTVVDLGKMLLISAKEGNTAQVRELMTKGAPFSTDWLGTSPLHLAAMNNHLETCEVLIRAGLNKDARTKVDRTPLHFAVYEGHEQIVDLLVSTQCDVDARDMLRMTPLHWAVEKRHKKIVEILLRHGADPNADSKFRKTPISMALENGYNEIYLMLDAAYRLRLENPEQLQRATNSITVGIGQSSEEVVKAPIGGGKFAKTNDIEEILDTPSPPINSSSIDEDNGMTLSDAIIRLQTIDGKSFLKKIVASFFSFLFSIFKGFNSD